MSAAEMKEILKSQYGIENEEEFYKAVEESKGINIGVFTTQLSGRSTESEQKTKKSGIA